MKAIFIDIDNTLLDFDAYVRTTMERGFAHFGLPAYLKIISSGGRSRRVHSPSPSFKKSAGTMFLPLLASILMAPPLNITSVPPCMRAPSQSPVP